jgi:stage IV sporulation protein FB
MITIPGRIPISIHPLFWMLIIAIGWLNSLSITGTLIWAVVISISVLVHEFGHALTAIAFGQKAKIDLVGMGGLTTRSGKTLKYWQEFFVILNGPLAGIALYFFAFYMRQGISDTQQMRLLLMVLNITIVVNLFWTLLNLLPIQPLDGGRLFSIIMEKLFGLRGVKIALFLSMCLAGGLGLLFFYFNNLFGGSIFFIFMYESYRNWNSSLVLTEQDSNSQLQELLKEADEDLKVGRTQTAFDKFQKLRDEGQKGILYLTATERMATILNAEGKYQQAYELLKDNIKKLDAESLRLLQQLSYHLGYFLEASDVGQRLYQMQPNFETAFINALCSARQNDKQSTLGWLQSAIREGLPNWQGLLRKTEFDFIREDTHFQNLLKKVDRI